MSKVGRCWLLFAGLMIFVGIRLAYSFYEGSVFGIGPHDNIHPDDAVRRLYSSEDNGRNHSFSSARADLVSAEICTPQHQIVFLKTHKTGSSTMTTVIQRYGLKNGLVFLSPTHGHILSHYSKFDLDMVIKKTNPYSRNVTFNILCNHVRYDHDKINDAVPNATHVTIVREPASQFESMFSYFKIKAAMRYRKGDAIEEFLRHPAKYCCRRFHGGHQTRNGMSHDLGLDYSEMENETAIEAKLAQLAAEFDFVLINEHFDESLIILKRKLCWDFSDILYIKTGVRRDDRRTSLDDRTIEKIRAWNWIDVKLYERFLRSFRQQVADYGDRFQEDLATFRAMQGSFFQKCYTNKTIVDDRTVNYLPRQNAAQECKAFYSSDSENTKKIKKLQNGWQRL